MKAAVARVVPLAVTCMLSVAACLAAVAADPAGWIALVGDHGFDGWRQPTGDWILAGDARPDPTNHSRLVAESGRGTLVNGVRGKTRNLLSKQDFVDLEAHFEFQIPKGSNSGVKFEMLYEIQISDSFGKAKPTASDCGGIYPAPRCCRGTTTSTTAPPRASTPLGGRETGRCSTWSFVLLVSMQAARRSRTPGSSEWS